MKCPRCGAAMRAGNYEADVQVDSCPGCRGVWLDQGELEKIQETIERDYDEELGGIHTIAPAYEQARQQRGPDIRCPKCAGEMFRKEYAYCSQILIDVCPKCSGLWLDHGELKALEVFFEQERPDLVAKARPDEVRRGFWASLLKMFGG